jgi:hypothetical protein
MKNSEIFAKRSRSFVFITPYPYTKRTTPRRWLARGRPARQVFSETAQEFQKDGYTIGLVVTLEWMARLYVAVSKVGNAARLIGWADATREEIGNIRPLLEQADMDRDVATVVARIGRGVFEEA